MALCPNSRPEQVQRDSLFYDFVGAGQQGRRDGDAKRLRRLEIDHKLELGRLLDWKFRWLRALKDLVNIGRRAPI
jgi:hypothetical protein